MLVAGDNARRMLGVPAAAGAQISA
jgi:hypothetical protein